MQFPDSPIANAVSELMHERGSDPNLNLESALGSGIVYSALELVEDFSESVHEGEPNSDITESLPLADDPMDETLEAESYPDIDHNQQDPIIEDLGSALELKPSVAIDDLCPCNKPPTNRTESIPVTTPPRIEKLLSGDTIRVTELADLLGIRGYEVLRDLVELGRFVKTTDTVSAELAVKVGLKHGVDFFMAESAAEGEGTRNDVLSTPDTSANFGKMTFQIRNGRHVRAGDWIRDSELGLGRILKLNTDQDEPDRHKVWFVGKAKEGTVVERHALYSSTLGIIDYTMVPDDIRSAAPVIA